MTHQFKNSDDKPLGAALGWERLQTSRPYRSHWHNLRQDIVRLPNGEEITYTYQEHPGFVTVVPITPDNQVVMIRSYRYTVDDWCWELPAGGLGDRPGVPLEQVARDELAEETGGQCQSVTAIGWFYCANGTTSARCHVFLAKGVVLTQAKQLESTEHSEVHLMPLVRALQMARDGRITDSDSALALLRCEHLLLGRQRRIEVVPYDPAWPVVFDAEAARLAVIFAAEMVSIHHMGSTAIPGLHAKPVVDIMLIVTDIERVDPHNDVMVAIGYVPKGEYGIPGRRFFSLDVGPGRLFNLHIYGAGNPEIERHLDFIEYLRTHPDEAQAYGELKQELARRFPEDIDSYVDGKTKFIVSVDQQAREWKENRQP